jgi:hypothetical protein
MNGKGVRSFWLNALIITTVVVMWLWLAATILIGGTIAYGLANAEVDNGSWKDFSGYQCRYEDTDGEARCPQNPYYAGD